MSRIWISLAALLVAVGAMAQEPAVQSGTPALLEAQNGNKIGVFLQRLENRTLTFQPRKSTKTMSVSITKVKSLPFSPSMMPKPSSSNTTRATMPLCYPRLFPLWNPMRTTWWWKTICEVSSA